MQNSFSKGLKDGIPIAMGYLGVSFTFGMMVTEKGLPVLAGLLISMTNLTSAGQFAGLAIIASAGTYIEMILTQLVINLRYSLMSISVSQKLDSSVGFLSRILIAFGITDEIFAVATNQKGDIGKKYVYGLISLPYIGWAVGTLIGAVASNLLPLSVRSALGIAIYGMFIAIIFPAVKKSKAVLIVIIIAIFASSSFAYIPLLGGISSGFAIIVSAVIAAGVGAIFFPVKKEDV